MLWLRRLFGSGVVAIMLTGGGAVLGQPPPPRPPQNLLNHIRNDHPPFLVRIDVDHKTRDYREGDGLKVRVACEVDAYCYVLYRTAEGKISQILPNKFRQDNFIRARQAQQIPGDDDWFSLPIQAPFGVEEVKVIASKKPLKLLGDPGMKKALYNPVSAEQMKGVELELQEEKPVYSEDSVTIHTYAKDQAVAPRNARRWGVFFGVARHEFDVEFKEATGKGLNLATCHRDARELHDLLKEVGQLSGYKLYTNDQATRAKVYEALCEWLPEVSRPGDTVIFFYSGHGMMGANQACLVTYDLVSERVVDILDREYREGKLDPHLRPEQFLARRKVWGQWTDQGRSLARETGITDDTIGHWLQRLDGRQVIVILDVCHAGAFAAGGKTKGDVEPFSFKLFDERMNRLKDIGQNECTLLAACAADQVSLIRDQNDLSVLTYYLLEGARSSSGPRSIWPRVCSAPS